MSNVAWLATAVTIFAQGNSDGTPGVSVVPMQTYANFEQCDEWSKERYSDHSGLATDPITGRVVTQFIFNCSPIDPKRVSDSLLNPV